MTDLSPMAGAESSPPPPDGPHYLRAVTAMAERCQVVAQSAIYTDSGVKLVEKGARIDARLYGRLLQHLLSGPIDGHLSVDNAVDAAAIEALARAQCAGEPLALRLAQALGGAQRLLAPLRFLLLPQPLAFKLTVMREQRPDLLAHSVRMMLVALYLGVRSGWGESECVPLAAAALLHDIGVLHMDPAWRDPEQKIMGAGRKHLVVHPVTAMLIVRAQQAYPRSVSEAVLEHHERMDGSGYPRGLAGGQISPMGQILLMAEVVPAFFEKYADRPAQRLSLMLRLNHRKFPAALVALMLPLLAEDAAPGADPQPLQRDVGRHIEVLSDAFARWADLRAQLPAQWLALPSGRACAFVDLRLAALQRALVEAGSHPRQQADVLEHLQGDAQGLAELALVGREALWQLQSIVNESQRRWPQVMARADAADTAVADWCDACSQWLAQA
jgi:HD-GYP domain-containing protein (c-di-GMP phosphodiesterase class II)